MSLLCYLRMINGVKFEVFAQEEVQKIQKSDDQKDLIKVLRRINWQFSIIVLRSHKFLSFFF